MIYYGMTPDPSLTAGMVLTQFEKMRLTASKLKSGCRHQGNKFVCEYREKGNDIYIGTFDTIAECNAAWSKEDEKRKGARKRKPAGKGYATVQRDDGRKLFKPSIAITDENGRNSYYLGLFSTKEKARNQYLLAIDKINDGNFYDWFKTIKKEGIID